MTEPATPATAPAGWYPTAPGSPELRWWDGTQWTNHSHTLGMDSGQQLQAPEGTTASTPWIWIYALLPLLQLAEIPLISAFYTRIFSAGFQNSRALMAAEYAPDSGYWALQGLGLLAWAVFVVVGLFDYRALRARGVPRPFHWAWSFLNAWVYVIGRAVVAHRRTGSGYAPMVVFIFAVVIDVTGILVVVFSFVGELVHRAG